ncbi:MAG TPA: FAD-binding oxidoreductase [Thermoleophilaceae bacterium]|jgi:FAD/FMN-containing dehydrogenase|nr:FAD-binding oxidoreductase [Thermoleophilaceae bacterium]
MAQAVLDSPALEGFAGELVREGDPAYDELRRVFNAAIDRKPALIARCAGVADVMAALACAREHGLEVSVRGGGHSVAGHAVVDGGVMIDLRPMSQVRVDPEQRVAWCGGGANWGQLDRETQAFGLAVTGGRMPDTGVGGLTLGGGSGWLERKYGFTVDSLRSVEIVTADGQLVVASAERNPELFWALKGGGGNFGVVTGFEFRLHEVGPLLYGGMMMFPAESAVDLLKAYRAFMEDAPDEICGGSAILCAPPEEFVPEPVRGKPVLAIIGCYVGPVEAGEAAFAPLLEWGPALSMMQPMPYTIVQQLISPGNPPGRQHYWKAGFLDELSDAAIETFVAHATNVASPFQASLMLPLGGAFARAPEGDTPLKYRTAKWDYHVLGQWDDPADAERNITWVRDFDAVMAEYAEEGVYVNFVADPTASAIEAGFGSDNYARLVAVKDKYDPDNLFRSNTNIPPSS